MEWDQTIFIGSLWEYVNTQIFFDKKKYSQHCHYIQYIYYFGQTVISLSLSLSLSLLFIYAYRNFKIKKEEIEEFTPNVIKNNSDAFFVEFNIMIMLVHDQIRTKN